MQKNNFSEIAKVLISEKENLAALWWQEVISSKSKDMLELIGIEKIKFYMKHLLNNFFNQIGESESRSISDDFKKLLTDFSNECTIKNITAAEISTFIFSIKNALFPTMQKNFNEKELMTALLYINQIIDQVGMYSFDIFLKTKEDYIREQHSAMQNISVPVAKLWNKIYLIPLVGMLDSNRTMLMMEKLLSILETEQARVVILDISGIPIVDSLVARHLIMTVSSARLMGASCIITGIGAKIAQTVVQLGVDLSKINTKSTLSDGFRLALDLTEQEIR